MLTETMVDDTVKSETFFENNVEMPEAPDLVNMECAEKSLRTLRYWRDKKAEIRDHANRERERIDRWEKAEMDDIGERIAYHESVLKIYLESTGKKSVKLINGAIKSRQGTEKVVFVEADGVTPDKKRTLFTDWARVHKADLVKTEVVEKIDAREVLKAVKEDGEVFPGVDIVVGDTSYTFETI